MEYLVSPKRMASDKNVYALRSEETSLRSSSGSIPHLHINASHNKEEHPIAHVDMVEEFIHDDAEKLRENFKQAYEKVVGGISRPRVLIAGVSGAGKSSIINTIFGSEIAAEGAGRPITQHFMKYTPENQPITLFDSKGLEAGMSYEEFAEDTLDFFTNHENDVTEKAPAVSEESNGVLAKKVHMVWYVVNAAAARFQDFEERVCRELFGNLPIVFILNKADIATTQQLDSLRGVVEKMEHPYCLAVLESVTQKYCKAKAPEVCAQCGLEEDLVILKKLQLAQCQNCNTQTPFVQPMGLHRVLETTFAALPNIAREAFVSAQRLSFQMKDQRAQKIITEFYSEQSSAFTTQGLLQIIAKMLTRLSLVWEFRDHGHLYASHIAKDLVSSFSIQDKIFLFVHKNKHQKLRSTAIGIIWNRCVRALAKIVFVESVEGISQSHIEEHWHLILEDAFQHLNDEEVDHIEQELKEHGLAQVLASELIVAQKPVGRNSSIHLLLEAAVGDRRSSSTPAFQSKLSSWDAFMSNDNTPIDSCENSRDNSVESSPLTSPDLSPRSSGSHHHHHHKKHHHRKGSDKRHHKGSRTSKRSRASKTTPVRAD